MPQLQRSVASRRFQNSSTFVAAPIKVPPPHITTKLLQLRQKKARWLPQSATNRPYTGKKSISTFTVAPESYLTVKQQRPTVKDKRQKRRPVMYEARRARRSGYWASATANPTIAGTTNHRQ